MSVLDAGRSRVRPETEEPTTRLDQRTVRERDAAEEGSWLLLVPAVMCVLLMALALTGLA